MGSLLGMTSGVPVGECLLNEQPLQQAYVATTNCMRDAAVNENVICVTASSTKPYGVSYSPAKLEACGGKPVHLRYTNYVK